MITWFFQRFALPVGLLVGLIVTSVIFPKEAAWWLKALVGVPVCLIIYALLYKDGVTANRKRR